jgi:RNA polymerase sigma-70 factor (ECF subfamily)
MSTAALPIETTNEEEALLQRWSESEDREALADLTKRVMDFGWRVARRSCNTAADADDVLQEAIVLLMTQAKSFRVGSRVRPWFAAIIVNAARMKRRSETARQRREGVPLPPENHSESVHSEIGDIAMSELEQLPEHERLPVWLSTVEGLSCREIAQAVGVREGTVRSQISRGLERLRDAISRRGFQVTSASLTAALMIGKAEAAPATALTSAMTATSVVTPAVAATSVIGLKVSLVALTLASALVGGAVIANLPHLPLKPPETVVLEASTAIPLDKYVRLLGDGPVVASGKISAVALAPQGTLLATSTVENNGGIVLWDATTGARVKNLPVPGSATSIRFSDDGTRLIVTSMSKVADEHRIRNLDIADGHEISSFLSPNYFSQFSLTPNGRMLLIPGNGSDRFDGTQKPNNQFDDVLVYDIDNGRRVGVIGQCTRSHLNGDNKYTVSALGVSRDGQRVFTLDRWHHFTAGESLQDPRVDGGWNSLATVAEIATGRHIAQWRMPSWYNTFGATVDWLPDGKRVFVSSLWKDEHKASLLLDIDGKVLQSWIGVGRVAPDGKSLVIINEGTLQRINPDTYVAESILSVTVPGEQKLQRAEFSADGRRFACTFDGNLCLLVDVAEKRQIAPNADSFFKDPFVTYAPDGRLLACDQTAMRIFDEAGQIALRCECSLSRGSFSISREGRFLITHAGNGNDGAEVWDLIRGSLIGKLEHDSGSFFSEVSISPDDRIAVSSSRFDQTLLIHHLNSGKINHTIVQPPTPEGMRQTIDIRSSAWTADSKRLIIGDATAFWWGNSDSQPPSHVGMTGILDVTAGRIVTRFPHPQTGVPLTDAHALAFCERRDLIYLETNEPLAGLWRTDGRFVRRVDVGGSDATSVRTFGQTRPRFDGDGNLLISTDAVVDVDSGQTVRRFNVPYLRSQSPSATTIAIITDRVIQFLDARTGFVFWRRPYPMPVAMTSDVDEVIWHPAETQVTVHFKGQCSFAQVELFPPLTRRELTSDELRSCMDGLDANFVEQREAGISRLVAAGDAAVPYLAACLHSHQGSLRRPRLALFGLEWLAREGSASALRVLKTYGDAYSDPVLGGCARDAMRRIERRADLLRLRAAPAQSAPIDWQLQDSYPLDVPGADNF